MTLSIAEKHNQAVIPTFYQCSNVYRRTAIESSIHDIRTKDQPRNNIDPEPLVKLQINTADVTANGTRSLDVTGIVGAGDDEMVKPREEQWRLILTAVLRMVAANTVDFYGKANYDSLMKAAKLDDVEHQVLGTSYRSCKLGDGTKLLVWNHEDYADSKELTSDQANLPEDPSVECCKVLKGTTSVVGVRFKDATGGEKGQYSLLLKLAQIGDVMSWSDMSDKYAIAGTVPRDGTLVTTALYVRDKKSGVYVATGSIYFQWDNVKNQVVILDQEGWPEKQLKHEDDGQNNFTITLISTQQ
ncbi:hypothetical protein CFD26_103831 [Aspergillus turcosus]|uniref:Calcium-dependent cell adhesion molecule 1 membrane-binding domain-containing protein n=1 Tax=Aspergillus turcosus TaxID=1245748 RepID=A0A421D4D9_9EURO|nr:hypothetical protein CFD26_103831 [Aspergillus turcosus]